MKLAIWDMAMAEYDAMDMIIFEATGRSVLCFSYAIMSMADAEFKAAQCDYLFLPKFYF